MNNRIEELIELYDYCRIRLIEDDGSCIDVWAVPTSQEYSDLIDSDKSYDELAMFVVVEMLDPTTTWLNSYVHRGMPVATHTRGENLPESSREIITQYVDLIVKELMILCGVGVVNYD